MKFGELLTCETKDKAEVGKKYIFGDNYKIMKSIQHGDEKYGDNPAFVKLSTLKYVSDIPYPFNSAEASSTGSMFQFALEVLDKEPQYRPYESCDEMIADFKERFKDYEEAKFRIPLIWTRGRDNPVPSLIDCFSYFDEETFISYFDGCVYEIDGSPVGKRIDA
jgi:hypothetical protein